MWISCNECNKHGLVQTLPHFPQQPCIFLLAQLPPTGMLLNDSQYSRKCQRKGLWNYLYDSRRVALTLSSLLCLLVLSWTCCRELCCSKARLLENHCVRTVWLPLNWVFLSPPQRWWLEAWSISVWKYVWITYIWSRGPVHPSKWWTEAAHSGLCSHFKLFIGAWGFIAKGTAELQIAAASASKLIQQLFNHTGTWRSIPECRPAPVVWLAHSSIHDCRDSVTSLSALCCDYTKTPRRKLSPSAPICQFAVDLCRSFAPPAEFTQAVFKQNYRRNFNSHGRKLHTAPRWRGLGAFWWRSERSRNSLDTPRI